MRFACSLKNSGDCSPLPIPHPAQPFRGHDDMEPDSTAQMKPSKVRKPLDCRGHPWKQKRIKLPDFPICQRAIFDRLHRHAPFHGVRPCRGSCRFLPRDRIGRRGTASMTITGAPQRRGNLRIQPAASIRAGRGFRVVFGTVPRNHRWSLRHLDSSLPKDLMKNPTHRRAIKKHGSASWNFPFSGRFGLVGGRHCRKAVERS